MTQDLKQVLLSQGHALELLQEFSFVPVPTPLPDPFNPSLGGKGEGQESVVVKVFQVITMCGQDEPHQTLILPNK